MSEFVGAVLGPSGNAPRTIVVIKPSSFGDVVHALPAIARLKTAWPRARVSWVVNAEWAPLLAENPFVDEVIVFPRSRFRGWTGAARFWRWCRENVAVRKPDLAVDLQGLLRSALIGRASGAKRRVGMSDAREGARFFYDFVAPMPSGAPHSVERYLATVDGVLRAWKGGIAPSATPLSFPLPPGDPLNTEEGGLAGQYILLHPFARGQGKSLSFKQIHEVCRLVAPMKVVLAGKCLSSPQNWPENCVDLVNRTSLPQLIWLIRRADSVITVDSGPSHLAAALGRPMVAIHTWSDPRRVGPYREDARVWKNGRLASFREMRGLEESFFRQRASEISERDLAEIARLATSFLHSSE